jgi:hypothetical protein
MRTCTPLLAFVGAMIFAREGLVSGGFRECYTDLGGVLCVESDVRKMFSSAEQAEEWLAHRRGAAEHRLQTVIPALRDALAASRAAGLPLAAVDDWRLSPFSAAKKTGPQRVHLDLGQVERDLHSLVVTTTRALTDDERAALLTRLRRALRTPPPPPEPVRDVDSDASDDGARPQGLRPPRPPPLEVPGLAPPRGTPRVTEDVRTWQPLFVTAFDGLPLAIGIIARVSPIAQARWRPWLQAQLTALRAAIVRSAACGTLPASTTAPPAGGFAHVDGFRPWGPLLLGRDVQARVDDGELVRMARLQADSDEAASALYGTLTTCLHEAAAAAPLPSPPH